MRPDEIDQFFQALAAAWPFPEKIILVGGAAACLMGDIRPTNDIDFEARPGDPDGFSKALKIAEVQTGIVPQFSEHIERWSQINFMEYRNHVRPYKTFGKLAVFLLEPAYWSIGKITRYYDQDVMDMIAVFKKEKVDPVQLAGLWKQALEASPRSTMLSSVQKQALHFFRTQGKRIWGSRFDAEPIVKILRPSDD